MMLSATFYLNHFKIFFPIWVGLNFLPSYQEIIVLILVSIPVTIGEIFFNFLASIIYISSCLSFLNLTIIDFFFRKIFFFTHHLR